MNTTISVIRSFRQILLSREERQHFLRQIPTSIQNSNINSKRAENKNIIDHLRKVDSSICDHGTFEWDQIQASYPMIDRVKRNCHLK
mgnify:CR=1 FL=1